MIRRPGSIYYKLVAITFALILLILSASVLIVSWNVSNMLRKQTEIQLEARIDDLSRYVESGSITRELVQNLMPANMRVMEVSNEPPASILSERELEQLEARGVVVYELDRGTGEMDVALLLEQRYITIYVDVSPILAQLRNMLILALVIPLLLGAVIIVSGLYRLTKPLVSLSSAAAQVTDGDFTVSVKPWHSEDEMGTLISNFNIMTGELGKMEILRSSFISDISHEFKNPLTSIAGYGKLLQRPHTPEDGNEYAQVIIDETNHLTTLVDNILLLNRLEQQNMPILEDIRLDEQIRQALNRHSMAWTEKNIEMQVALQQVHMQGIGSLMMQVWSNLVDNAIKFSPRNGVVSVTLIKQEAGYIFTIEDTGPGIPEDYLDYIFDKFFQADSSRGVEGNGLGLAIVKKIVELHGGTISVSNQPDSGCIFCVQFHDVRMQI